MGVIITCDSTIDLTPELVKKYDLKVIPLFVNLDEETFLDGSTVDDIRALDKNIKVHIQQDCYSFEEITKLINNL